MRFRLIAKSQGNDTLIPFPGSKETVVVEFCSPTSSQRLFGLMIIAFLKGKIQPGSNQIIRVGSLDGFTRDDVFPPSEIGLPVHINIRTHKLQAKIERLPRQSTIDRFCRV